MKILDVNGNELNENDVDYSKGYLKKDEIAIKHHDAIEAKDEVWHYDYIEFLNSGGIELVYVVDEPAILAVEAYDEMEEVLRYVLYTEEELVMREYKELMQYLYDTDYVVLKVVEGVSTKDDYLDIFDKRKEVRERISVLKDRYKL